jgi:FkbM family methyltransferase
MRTVYHEAEKVWWPAYEKNFLKCHQRVMSRITDMDLTFPFLKGHDLAVQAGGHAGLWPLRLAGTFGHVVTFEPDPSLFEAMLKNFLADKERSRRIVAGASALGDRKATVMLKPEASAGAWSVDPVGTFPAHQITIDALELPACDAIYLDVEAYEVEALTGALATIDKFRPLLYVEELPRVRDRIRRFMSKQGYSLKRTIHADAIYVAG